MKNSLGNAPTTDIVKQVISFLQWLFSKSKLAIDDYKWDPDDSRSLIRISKPFSIDDSKPLSRPCIVVSKGSAAMQNRVLDNLASANKNVYDNPKRVDLININIQLTVCAGAADEASNLAAFALHNIHMHRHSFAKKIPYVHEIRQQQLTPEQPRQNQVGSEIYVWEAGGVLSSTLKLGWYEIQNPALIKWNTMEIIGSGTIVYESDSGETFRNSNILKDANAHFGNSETDNPELTQENIDKDFYFIEIENQPFLIKEIVNGNMLKLAISNSEGAKIDFTFKKERKDINYKIHWNKPYLRMVLPDKNS